MYHTAPNNKASASLHVSEDIRTVRSRTGQCLSQVLLLPLSGCPLLSHLVDQSTDSLQALSKRESAQHRALGSLL